MPSRPSRKLSQLIREKPTAEDIEKTLKDLRTVHDRAAAIIVATTVDDALRDLLLHKMVTLNSDRYNSLFGVDRPLSSFAAKINIAYAFNVISDATRGDLEAIKNIRNAFAHARKPITFKTPEIEVECGKMDFQAMLLGSLPLELDLPKIINLKQTRSIYIAACRYYDALMRAQQNTSRKII